MRTSRRILLKGGVLTGAATLAPGSLTPVDLRSTAAATPFRDTPFSLGVASGDPLPDGFVIWTRLAVQPLADDGLGGVSPHSREIRWQVARDERFRYVEASGRAWTGPAEGHSVHVEVHGLRPGREYFYRFRTDREVSPVGRTRTAPDPASYPSSLAMSFASCAQLEHGWFTAYRRMAEDEPELVLHLGDYLYEYSPGTVPADSGNVRAHEGPETASLADYRRRHAQYKTDPDLQLLHATAPWVVVFDDHEVCDNWADEVPRTAASVPYFRDRRAAALRAYYENMPLRRSAIPRGLEMVAHRRLAWGRLATFHMLDTRQHRDDQSCGDGMGSCGAEQDAARSILGESQESWLAEGFAASTATWDFLGQQVPFARMDTSPTPDERLSMDSWDGYPACRDRVVRAWQDAGVRNPVVLTGDVHDHLASEVLSDWEDPSSVLAPELVCTSITSGGDGHDSDDGRYRWAEQNPHIRFWTDLRGYVRTRVTPDSVTADFRCLTGVSRPDQPAFTRASYVIADGDHALHQVSATPLSSL
ncbi:alkaline phosphatase D family protein [Nocardioides gansuensis]|uniref:alkaline phosphatase D family protein n=1 Tax=Nocardioides gansuensis TaxID=2138300 RepID=UPI001FEC63E0|nr:alkaline phosphatase D family protein [Nocardioides gansuensis]